MKIIRSFFILNFSFFIFFLSGCATDNPDNKCTKVLMIGNSFSISLMSNMPKVAESLGIPLDLTSLYIGGCSLERHVENLGKDGEKDFAPYSVNRSIAGKSMPRSKANLPDILKSEVKYDVITIQQASHFSWQPKTYTPWGDELIAAIRKYQPQAKIYVQETWSYAPWDKRFAKWGIDQNGMYEKLRGAYAAFAAKYGFPVIRMGTAVQEWRKRLPVKYTENSFGGDVVGGRFQLPKDQFKRKLDNTWEPNSDVFHLNEKGEYFQSLVWTAKLFNADVSKCEFRPDSVTEDEAKLMKDIANELK